MTITNTTKYNGWNNYETWLCNMWFDSSFDFTDDLEMFESCESNDDVLDIIENYIQSTIEEFVECSFSPGDAHGFINDMLNSAMSEIDYREIAEHYVQDVIDELELRQADFSERFQEVA